MKNKIEEHLKEVIPYKWRIQNVSDSKPWAQCVAYIDARDVMDRLDEVVGIENWKDDYKVVDEKLVAGIGIYDETAKQWVWKWDTGTESTFEKQKGHFSDAFKRAAVKWGIGRFLYNLDIKYVKTNKPGKGARPVDDDGNKVWDLTKHITNGNGFEKPYDSGKRKKKKKKTKDTKSKGKRPPKPTDWKLHCDKHNKDMKLKYSEKKKKWYQYHYDDNKGMCFGGGYKGKDK